MAVLLMTADMLASAANASGENEMITETRQITFSPSELIDAVVAHIRSQKQSLPEGKINSIQLEETPDITIALLIQPSGSDKVQRVILRPEVVGAALIAHCKRRGIPVPRKGVKSLIVSGDSIGLVISTGGKPTSLFEIATE